MSSGYWPNRPSAKGFSIEKLSQKCRAKIKELSKRDIIYNQNTYTYQKPKEDSYQQSFPKEKFYLPAFNHWANRDFREYFKAIQ